MGAPFFEERYSGFALANQETLELLTKALTAGSGVDAASFTGGRALTPESLDYTLANILHTQDEARLFQRVKKQPIKSVVRHWNKRTEVGSDAGAWVAEGGTSNSTSQTIARAYATAKFLQTYRYVTLQAASTDMVEDAMAIEQNAGTLWLIRNIEKGLLSGDSAMVPEEIDGLKKQVPAANVIDMRGASGDSATMENKIVDGCRLIRNSYGKASLLLGSTQLIADIQKLLRDRLRWPNPGANGQVVGSAFPTNYPTPFGNPEILDDIFLTEGDVPGDGDANDAGTVCGAPTLGSGAHSGTGSQFAAGDAGDYVYKVVAENKYGLSVASAEIIITGVAAGESVTFAITKSGTGTPSAYRIYRSIKGGITAAEVRFMERIAYSASPQTFTDDNSELPGCSDAYLLTMDSMYDAIEWFQFLPMMKFPLFATNAAIYPFLMLLYGGLILKKDVQHVRIKNIYPSSGTWF